MLKTPSELKVELDQIVKCGILDPVLILGPSGIGKTSIVNQVTCANDMQLWDVRWGQLMPADARGVPVPRHEEQTTVFYPPSFWPRSGRGIIFLDEFNMATPSMMGLGQQLFLDRRFGDYRVPDGILVWAAGNRRKDRAAVNDLPGPVNNRVAHYEVEQDLASWEEWAHPAGIDSRIVGFLKWRSELLHKFDPNPDSRAWPSPRSWEMADRRLKARMPIDPVVGEPCADEFRAFVQMLEHLPNIAAIANGEGKHVDFPTEASLKFATMAELTRRSLGSFQAFSNSFEWGAAKAVSDPDWVSYFVQDFARILKKTKPTEANRVLAKVLEMPNLRRFVKDQVAVGGLL